MAEATLFDLDAAEAGPKLGRDARRTVRQQQVMANGRHPLALLGAPLRLHSDAPPVGDRKAPGPRCGGCELARVNAWNYLKCARGRSGEMGTPSFRRGPYETASGATDLRAWWPGCERWEARRA